MSETTPEERLAALEESKRNSDKQLSELWAAIHELRNTNREVEDAISKAITEEITKVCKKLTLCQSTREVFRENIKKEVIGAMTTELAAMKDLVDKVWSYTWKALAMFAAAVLAMAGWNIALAQRISSTEQEVAVLQQRQISSEQLRVTEQSELMKLLSKIDRQLSK